MREIREQLLRAVPVKVDKTSISMPTLREIFDYGLVKYLEGLQSIIIDLSEIDLNQEALGGEELSDYQIFLLLILTNESFKNTFFEAMQMFTGETFVLEQNVIVSVKRQKDDEGHIELVFNQLLDEKFWVELRKVLTIAHWQKEPKKYQFVSVKAREIMDKLKKNKDEVQKIKAKQNDSDSLELYELIGSVCAHSASYNLFNVWDLTYYQFFDHYYRLNINDNYHFSLQSILAGADPKKVKVEHWASSIQNI